MSSTEEAKELKAGHPPAVKAGGMRIARTRQTSTGEAKEAAAAAAEGEEFSTTPPKSEKHNQKILISGAVQTGDKDFTADAIKQYHDKPIPAKEKRPVNTSHNINQPR